MNTESLIDYCDKYSEQILGDLEQEIASLNLPKYVHNRLIDIIVECEGEILEYRFEQSIGEYEGTLCDRFRESKIF